MIFFVSVAALGYSVGVKSERHQASPHQHAERAKSRAQRACAGSEPSRVFDCVYEEVEASEQTSRSEQDLSAQQEMATWAFLMWITSGVTLVVSAAGLFALIETIRQGRENLDHSKRVSSAQLRPHVFLTGIRIKKIKGVGNRVLRSRVRNHGISPARDVDVRVAHQYYPLPLPREMPAFTDESPVFPTIRPNGQASAYRVLSFNDSQVEAIRKRKSVVWCAVSVTYRPYPDSEPETTLTQRVFYGPDLDRGRPRLIPEWMYHKPEADEDGQEHLDHPPPGEAPPE